MLVGNKGKNNYMCQIRDWLLYSIFMDYRNQNEELIRNINKFLQTTPCGVLQNIRTKLLQEQNNTTSPTLAYIQGMILISQKKVK